MKYPNSREEEIKNKVGQDFFSDFDTTKIIGNVDFCVTLKNKNTKQEQLFELQSLLWAEAKKGDFDIFSMFAQLILTIGKGRIFDKNLPPAFLGAFDAKKIAFVPYNAILDVFSLNDFNWNVTPSNHQTKEFLLIKERIEKSLHKNHFVYDFLNDEKELKFFIKNNIAKASETGKIIIDKNNFVPIYLRWLDQVKPSINFDWTEGKKLNIMDSDFYLADLFVDDKDTAAIDDDVALSENLFVYFKNGHYEITKENLKLLFNANIAINDKSSYEQFWKKYKRPPLEEFQNYIIDRRDLLIPQDIRERKGAFFTPRKWVELSQKYLADVLGEDWQDEYYVWDCAAGTGNLLAGLTNKYNIWASTLDMADVNVMHERIENGAILLKDHVFQFDFLNDDFSKLPQGLQNIINDEHKRKRLVVYINPPYAEATSAKTVTGTSENKSGVTTSFKINEYFKPKIGNASNEIFALFMSNIYEKIPNCHLAQFSTLKFVQSSNFSKFKELFLANFLKGFIVPADSFDNVKGSFPIGFTIWNTNEKNKITKINCNVYDNKEKNIGNKFFYGILPLSINKWLTAFYSNNRPEFGTHIGTLSTRGNDFQNQKYIYLAEDIENKVHDTKVKIYSNNLIPICIYFAVRHCIDATWLNDRDQFLFPKDSWQNDKEFHANCLTFILFHSQNKVVSNNSTNHWIPFTEYDIAARDNFESNFMADFIQGKLVQDMFQEEDLFGKKNNLLHSKPLEFSTEAKAVFKAGKDLWKYYHKQSNCNVNASLYDIREHFQGRNAKGKMNTKSDDEMYMNLISELRNQLKFLAKKIEQKVYEHGFLKI